MRPHGNVTGLDPATTLAQISDQLLGRLELRAGWLIAIEISDKANAKRDVVQVIAVDMSAIDLPTPAIAHLDLSVARGAAVPDHEVIRQTILHPPDATVVIIKRARVALPGAAVVHDDEFPARALDRRAADRVNHTAGQIARTAWLAAAKHTRPKAAARWRRWC